MLINVKIPKIVEFFTFISMIKFMLSSVENDEKSFITSGFGLVWDAMTSFLFIPDLPSTEAHQLRVYLIQVIQYN